MIKRSLLLIFAASSLFAFEYIDFDLSMRSNKYGHVLEKSNNQLIYKFFRSLYKKNQCTVDTQKHQQRIPMIMHHVWFGSRLSDEFKQLRQKWIDMHPSWTFILWTDNECNDDDAIVVHSFQELDNLLVSGNAQRIIVITDTLMFDNRVHFNTANNYGERSDILKWEIVYRYGGVYIDTDFECYKSLDDLHYTFDFYTGLQPLDTHRVQLGAALFGAHPYHPILERCVNDIQPGHGPIVIRTGPIHFTNACLKTIANCSGCNVVLPASYFYPCGYDQQEMPELVWRKPESYAIHHWSGSWLKPEAFVK